MDKIRPLQPIGYDFANDKRMANTPLASSYVIRVEALVKDLPTAQQKMFGRILASSRISSRWMTRKEIALMLGHNSFLPHDITVINQLVKLGLVESVRRPRPILRNGMPNGSEYIYRLVPNVLWASNEISRKAKEARKNATKKSDVVHDFSRQPEELERKQRIDDLIKQADRANKPRARWQIFKRS